MMMQNLESGPPVDRSAAIRLPKLVAGLVAAHALFPVVWLAILLQDGPRDNDWKHFQVAADQFVSGAWSELYTERMDSVHPGYFWRYPPYALYAVAPLAYVSPLIAYLLLASTGIAALVTSLYLLGRVASPQSLPGEWWIVVLLSAPALTTLVTGQISGILLLCIAGACALWLQGRVVMAGAALGLLALKPNIGLLFGVYVLAGRHWRAVVGMGVVAAALCLATIPLGYDLWSDFLRVSLSNVNVVGLYEPHKMITIKAFFSALFGNHASATWIWGALSTAVIVFAFRLLLAPGEILQHLGIVTLLVIATNPYAFFYDALLLTVPAAAWWARRGMWARERWFAVAALIAIVWCWEQWAHTWREFLKFVDLAAAPPFSLVGPAAMVWLLIAVREELRISRGSVKSSAQSERAGLLS
jgi:hypothetical protein